MSRIRVPGSLRRSVVSQQTQAKAAPRKESKTATLVTAAALLGAASPLSLAIAQQGTLPPLSVETTQKKKAQAAPAKKSGSTEASLESKGAPSKDASPYADPNAPYKVDKSGSGKLVGPLVNIPKSITAIPKEVIQDKAATSIRELARSTPGVTLGFGEGGNAFGDRIFIRGFDARGDIYVDGLRDPGNVSREVFSLEQVEVYKGPGGSIGGRGTPGGAVNMISKLPNEYTNFYNVSTMFGTDDTFRTTVDVNQVLTPWLSVRGNVMYHQGDIAGRDFVDDERWGGFFAATIKPSSDFKVTLDYYRLRTDGMSDYGIPANPVTHLPWTEGSGINGVPALPRNTFYGNLDRDFMKNSQDAFTATEEWKVAPGITLTNKTRVGRNIADYVTSNPGQTAALYPEWVTIGSPSRYQVTDFVINQTDATVEFTTGSWQHTLVAGVELSRESVDKSGYTGDASGGLDENDQITGTQFSLFNPNNHRGGKVERTGVQFSGSIDTAAAYLLDTIKLNEQWYLNGGIRIDHFEKSQTNYQANGRPSPLMAPCAYNREDTPFTYHAGIVYKPIPIASIYAAIATAANPAGQEFDSNSAVYGGLDINSENLGPEMATGIEIGTKWELFNRRVLATAALFQTEKENAREVIGQGPNSVVKDTAAFRVRGIDLGVQGNITPRWSVFGGFVWMDTEVTKSEDPNNVGLDLANVPTMQFSLLTKYKLTDKLTVGGQAIYANELKGGTLAATTGYETPSFWRFDALAEYKVTDNFSVNLNLVNLTDTVYYDAVYQNQNNPFVHVAPGRAGYLTLNWKY